MLADAHPHEERRLTSLKNLDILDTDSEQQFDELVELASRICGTPISLISLVDSDRQWFKARKGVEAWETPLAESICAHGILQDEPLIIPDTRSDPRTADNPLNDSGMRMRFYAGVPLIVDDGLPIGSLCVIDTRPRNLDHNQLEALEILSRQVVMQLRMRSASANAKLQSVLLTRQRQELALANERLRAADDNKDRFLAMLSHELRNPLSALHYGLASLPDLRDAVQFRETTDMMSDQCHQLTRLLDDLMDVSRIDRGLIVLKRTSVDLPGLLKMAIDSVRCEAEQRRHIIELVSSDAQVFVLADSTRLLQIVVNLLTNAIRYTPVEGRITLSIETSDQSVSIHVKDNGIGIDLQDQASVFSVFSQVNAEEGQHSEGLGLGLALVLELVQLHHGKVEVSSEGKGQGTCFSIQLPKAQSGVRRGEWLNKKSSSDIVAQNVLIVDDNYASIRPLGRLLEKRGHSVRLCTSGLEALIACEERLPDVALVDISMPGMTGHEFAKQFRTIYPDAGVSLFATSGHSQPQDRRDSISAGFHQHLVKPLDIEFLLSLIGDSVDDNCQRGSI